MSYTEQQLWNLLDRAEDMMPGPGQIALVEQVIEHADAMHLPELGFAARMQATASYVYIGEPTKALVTFAWCVTEFDRPGRTGHRACGCHAPDRAGVRGADAGHTVLCVHR